MVDETLERLSVILRPPLRPRPLDRFNPRWRFEIGAGFFSSSVLSLTVGGEFGVVKRGFQDFGTFGVCCGGKSILPEKMAESSRRGEESPSRVQDWEVVSLTASAYAAAPGPNHPKQTDDNSKPSENQTSAVAFNSDHFIFPPRNHEGLAIQHEIGECIDKLEVSDGASVENTTENLQSSEMQNPGAFASENNREIDIRGKDLKDKEESHAYDERLDISYHEKWHSSFENLPGSGNLNLRGVEFLNEKQRPLPSTRGKDGEDEGARKGLDWIEPCQHGVVEEEEISVLASNLSVFHDKVGGMSGSNTRDEDNALTELQKEAQGHAFTHPEPLSVNEDKQLECEISSNPVKSPNVPKAKKTGRKDLPCEAWWKRQAASLRAQARQTNTLWSIAVAATLMGLLVLGHRWQHERWVKQQLKLQLCTKDEKISQILYQIARLKEALSGRRKVPIIRSSSSLNGFHDH